jgi:hypothetical protein
MVVMVVLRMSSITHPKVVLQTCGYTNLRVVTVVL